MLPLFHGSFTITKQWAAAPEKVFDYWADPALKAQWFSGPPGLWSELKRSMDFRRGGEDVLEGRFNMGGLVSLYEARYHFIAPPSRLVYSYDMHLNGAPHSSSLASIAYEADGQGTKVTYTEQIVFLDGLDNTLSRRGGTEWQLMRIEGLLAATS